jgi:hypothetical protein
VGGGTERLPHAVRGVTLDRSNCLACGRLSRGFREKRGRAKSTRLAGATLTNGAPPALLGFIGFSRPMGWEQTSMDNGRPVMRIKGLSHDEMELKRFTRSLNAELTLLGRESIDVLEAHVEYQGRIDDHEGTLVNLIRKIAAERTSERYVEEDEGDDEPLDEFEEEGQEKE